MKRVSVVRTLNAAMALVLMMVLASAYYQQFSRHEQPCPLCMLQRLGMIGVAMGVLMNLRFGIRVQHYGLSLFSAFFGGVVSARQMLLHICPGFPVFGVPVLGISLYTWAFIVFLCCLIAITGFLFFYSPEDKLYRPMNSFEKITFAVVVLLTLMNVITTFSQCSFGFCQDVPWPQP